MPGLTFSVDTHVFRELGELLVGRDSTALFELIKNSYDADATLVVVTAVNLEDEGQGQIVIRDNGLGMNEDRFTNGFLRIASRFKEEGPRRSEFYKRRFTGSKGIGRLAAHKLASFLEIDSVFGNPGGSSRKAIHAVIDWERIEQKPTLDHLQDEISLGSVPATKPRPCGTVISLSRLRRPWTNRERVKFVSECRAFQVPEVLQHPPSKRNTPFPPLFTKPVIRDATKADPGCKIVLEGDFSEGDDYWDRLAEATNWLLEIDSLTEKGAVRYSVSPSNAVLKDEPGATQRRFVHDHPSPVEGPFFQARIFYRNEMIQNKSFAAWNNLNSGVRIYMEGFRVLPYGEPNDDWLSIDANYTRRSWQTDEVFDEIVEDEPEAGDWQLLVSANRSYSGAVFLTQENATSLRMLINREGFVAESSFETLVKIVRRGIDLVVRTRAAATAETRRKLREERERARRAPQVPAATAPPMRDQNPPVVKSSEPVHVVPQPFTKAEGHRSLSQAAASAMETVKDTRRVLATTNDPNVVEQRLELTESSILEVVSAAERVRDTIAMQRVLASLGMQMAEFVHEIRSLLGTSIMMHETVGRLRSDRKIVGESRAALNGLFQSLGDQRRQIERQAAYLVDLTSTDARRRRARLSFADRFDSAARLIAPVAERKEIPLLNEIPPSLKSPPMFPAELTAVFSNLLSNAVKAASTATGHKSIRAIGEAQPSGGRRVVVENTGAVVDLADAERWFRPFESSGVDVDSSIGHGMGLGLTITRDVLEQYGATVRFVPPTSGYATAIEMSFSGDGDKK
ncbi:hypothetical protein BH11PLA2_BH11PLA2_29860 [soil metagenome]